MATYNSLADSPDSDDEETPLRRQRQKNDSGNWVRGALLLGLAVLASLVLASQPADETRRQRRDEAKRRSSLSAPKKHAYCVAHGAYGNYTRVARVASRSKRAYARSRGYGFVELLAENRDDFLATHCPELRGEAERAFSKTTPVKACGVWAALRDSCEAVLWTDADSIVVDGRLGVEQIIGDREAAFFLETTGVSGDCGTADEFAAHVDAGAFVLKSGSWAEVLLRQQLALSIFDNAFLEHSPCSTKGLDPLNPNWDQCHYAGKTEQCTLGCLYRTQPQLLERTRCVYASLASSPLGGVLLEPDYQVAAYGVNASSVAEFLGEVFPAIAPRADGLLVFNCMGGTAAEKVLCVEWATAFYGGGVDK